MTLHEYLEATTGVPTGALRRAMVRALAAEPARTPGAQHRFYARVLEQLAVAGVCRDAQARDATEDATGPMPRDATRGRLIVRPRREHSDETQEGMAFPCRHRPHGAGRGRSRERVAVYRVGSRTGRRSARPGRRSTRPAP